MYNPADTLDKTYTYIQGLRNKGHQYAGTPVYNVTKSDLTALKAITDKYGIPFEWMVNLINFESGRTFNPAIQNSIKATGLIQILPSTATGLGTTVDALKKMSFKQYLKYLDLYIYKNLKSKLGPDGKVPKTFTQGDLFMTIFYPVAVGKPNYTFPANVQKANAGIATPKDYVEKALRVSLFPLSVFPYTLTDVAKKFGEFSQTVNKNPVKTIMVALLFGTILTGTIMYFNK